MPHLLTKNKIDSPYFASWNITNTCFQPNVESLRIGFETAITLRSLESISAVNKVEIQNIKSFRNLKKNWDSYGALPIDEISIEKSISFIKDVNNYDKNIYLTSPGPNSEVLVQMRQKNKEIEFVFYPKKSKYVLFNNSKFIEQSDYKKNVLPKLMEWLDAND